MNMNPSKKQCELARVMTSSNVPDGVIKKELRKLTESEWFEQCAILDKFLQKYHIPFDKGYPLAKADLINIGTANGVDEATVFVAYMEWRNREKR